MINFLFGVLCAAGAISGSLLAYTGVINHSYEAVTAGGVFMFGSLLTFGIGQISRSLDRRLKQVRRGRHNPSLAPTVRVEPGASPVAAPDPETQGRVEPAAFPVAAQSDAQVSPQVLEEVASRFARPGR